METFTVLIELNLRDRLAGFFFFFFKQLDTRYEEDDQSDYVQVLTL